MSPASRRGLLLAFVSSALLLFSRLGFADCTGPEATPVPQETPAAQYQPHYYDSDDNTVLQRRRFAPGSTGTYPTVIIIHAGEFKEYDDLGSLGQHYADYDLVQAGFLVFSVEHRLAPPNKITGQTDHCSGDDCPTEEVESGRPPEQWNDIKQEIAAAYNDSQCNGEIFLLGASSGGTHAAWCALDPTPLPSPAPGWPLPTGTIKAVAGLSGVYDLSLRTPTPTPTFINDVDNYTNTVENGDGVANIQYNDSPISLVANATNIPPFLLFATSSDPVNPAQATNFQSALENRGASATEYTSPTAVSTRFSTGIPQTSSRGIA